MADLIPYTAPCWLPGGHLQTIYPALFLRNNAVAYRRARWDTPDGDFIDLDWIDGPAQAPLIALFHGLEGSSRSHYARALMQALCGKSLRGVVVHFRGCSGEPNRLPRAYHSGDAPEIDWILRRLRAQNAATPLYAIGVSLGGNALLKWLGDSAEGAIAVIDAAAAVSAPLDLMVAGDALGRGFCLVYAHHFLRTLKVKSLAKLARHPGLYSAAAVRKASTLRAFDDLVTAPLHGFKNTDDYWTRASSKAVLQRVRVPTLIINAKNDPFLPAHALPDANEVSDAVTLEQPAHGGHVGFVSGAFPGNFDWLTGRVVEFFASAPAVKPAATSSAA